jgi:multidrug resistance protein
VTVDPAEERHAGRRLPLLFFTVFVDVVGFGIVLPLLPLYGDRFGASGATIGLLVIVYPAIQLVLAPLWGRASDRFGRRPVIVVGLLGSAVSYVVFARADSLALLFLSRILAGAGGATVPVAEAYIADVTPPEGRAGNMGLIGAAFGLGFTVGPALGGALATTSLAAPGYLAAALCLADAALAWFLLPESRRRAVGAGTARFAGHHGLRALRAALGSPGLARILVLYFLVTAAFAVIQPTLSLLGTDRFALDARQVGYLFAFLGLVSAVIQGGVVRRIAPRFGEARLILLSATPFALGMLLVAVAPTIPVLLVALALLAVGYGGALPSVLSLVSRAAPDEMQGGVLGIGQSVGSLARIVGPAAAGALYDVSLAAPYLFGMALAALAGVGARRLRSAS